MWGLGAFVALELLRDLTKGVWTTKWEVSFRSKGFGLLLRNLN